MQNETTMQNNPSANPADLLDGKIQNKRNRFSFHDYGFLRALIFVLIGLALAAAVHYISLLFFQTSVFKGEPYGFITFLGIMYFLIGKKKRGCLDMTGFHYTEFRFFIFGIKYKTVNIPLSNIRCFRIQNDDFGVFIEIVTIDKSFRFYRSLFCRKNGTKRQNWIVSVGNAVLSNLNNDSNAALQSDVNSCTLARLYRNETLDLDETSKPANLKTEAEWNRALFTLHKKYPKEKHFLSWLIAGLFLLALSVCLGINYSYLNSIYALNRLFGNDNLEIVLTCAIIISFALSVYLLYKMKILQRLFSMLNYQQWTFTPNAAIRKRKLLGVLYARRKYDLTNYSYMEIQKYRSFEEYTDSLYDDNCKKNALYQLILFDENDRIIFEINYLEQDEAMWIANEVQRLLRN